MSGFLIVGSDKRALFIAGDDRLLDRAVEEDDRNAFFLCHVHNVLRGIIGVGVDQVDDQGAGAFCDRGCDLFGLRGLAAVCIVVLELQTGGIEQLVHGSTDSGNVGVCVGVVEDRDFSVPAALAGDETEQSCQGKCQSQDGCDELFHDGFLRFVFDISSLSLLYPKRREKGM